MIPAVAAALIGGGAGLLGSLFTNSANAGINKETRQWQSEENALQRNWQEGQNGLDRSQESYWNQRSMDWQEKMWNLQNQYNSPSAMMARYREAGLNPYLASTVGQGVGAAPAGSAGSPAINSAPAGSPSGMGSAPSPIAMQNPLAPAVDVSLRALGVSADVANQNAKTLSTKWEIYNSILENGDRKTAKAFLHANPDMLSDADPENSLYYKRWKRQDRQFELQNDLQETQNWLVSRYGDQEHQKALAEADARIENIISQMNERDANIVLLTEQLNTELEKQFNLHASGVESYANAETANKLRKWQLAKLIIGTGLDAYTYKREKASFDSEEELRNWLTSPEGKEAIKDMEKNGLLTNPTVFWRHFYQFMDHMPLSGGANVGVTKKLK